MKKITSEPKEKKKFSRKKKLLIFGSPVLFLVALVGVFFLYQMSRSYEEPTDSLPLDGLMSDMMPKPETGVPSDYTPQENAAIAQYVLLNTEHYQTTLNGEVKANVGFINYDQSVRNTKVVDGDVIFAQALSLSSMVKVGEQKYFNKGIYLLRKADGVESVEQCNWSDEISALSKEGYTDRYGMVPDGLSNYLITKETVLGATYEGEENGLYTYTYELDPDTSSVYYRRQVKTLSGSDKIPLFHSVRLTVTMNADWEPQKVVVEENYDISIPVVGMATCDGVLTEEFHGYGEETPIPDQALFQRYIDEEYDPNNLDNGSADSGDTDIMSYISNVFDTDENGKATLGIDFTLNDGTPQTAYVQVDTKNSSFKLKWDSLLLGYENERIYIKFGNIKYYLQQTDLMEAVQEIAGQLGLQLPSLEELMSPEMLNELMKHVQMLNVDGQTKIVFQMDGLEALINMTGDMKFIDARIGVDMEGMKLDLTARPVGTQEFEEFDDTYQDIKPVLGFSEPIINLINARLYAFTFHLDMVGDNNLNQTAQVRVSRSDNGIASAQIDANIQGKWLHIRIVGDTTYLTYGDLKFQFSTGDFAAISEELKGLLPEEGLDLSALIPQAYLDLFTKLDLNALANSIQSLELTDDNLSLKMKVGDDLITANVGRVGGQLTGAHLSGLTLLGSKVSVNAKMTAVSNYPSVIPVNPLGYTDLKGLTGFVQPILNLMNANTWEFDVNLGMKGSVNLDHSAHVKLVRKGNAISAQATTRLFDQDLELDLVDGVTYLQYGPVKAKLDTADLGAIMQQLREILPPDALELDLSKILPQQYVEVLNWDVFQWLDSVKRIQVTDTQAALTLNLGGDDVTLSAHRQGENLTGVRLQGLTLMDSKLDLSVNLTNVSPAQQMVTVNDAGYVDLRELMGFAKPVMELVNGRSYDINLSAALSGKVNFAQDARLFLTRTAAGADIELTAMVSGVPVSLKYINSTAYLQSGVVKVKLNTTDVEEISRHLNDILPKDSKEFDLSEVLPQAYLDLLNERNPGRLLDYVQSLGLQGETLTLTLKIGDDVIPVSVTRRGDHLASASLSGITAMDTKVAATATLNEVFPITQTLHINEAGFSNATELTAFVPDVFALLDANSYALEAKATLRGGLDLETTADILLVRTDHGVNVEASADLSGETLSLRFVDGVAYLRYGNLRFKLDTQDLEEITQTVRQIVPKEWMEIDLTEMIPAKYRKWMENPDIPTLMRSLTHFSAQDGVLRTDLTLGQETFSLRVVREADGLKSASLSGGDFAVSVWLKEASGERWEISKDDEGYVDVKDLLPFLKPVINAMQAQTYEMDLELLLLDKEQNTTLSVPGHLAIERTKDGVNALLTAEVLGEPLEVAWVDSTAYLSYGPAHVKLRERDIKSVMDAVSGLLPKNYKLDLSGVLPKAYTALINNPTPLALLGTLRSVELEDNLLTVNFKVGSDTIRARVATDGETFPYAEIGGVSVLDQKLYLTMRNLTFGSEPLNLAPAEHDYLDAKDLLDFLAPILRVIKANSWRFTAQVALDGQTYALDVQLTRTKNGLDFAITSQDFGGVPLMLLHTGSTSYIQYADIKLYLKDSDLNTALKKLRELLPKNLGASALLNGDFSGLLENLDLAALVGGLQSLSLDKDTLSVSYQLGGETIHLALTNGSKYPKSLSVSGLMNGSLSLTLDQLRVDDKISLSRPADAAQYVNTMDLFDCVEPLLYLLDAPEFSLNLRVMEKYGIQVRRQQDKIYFTYLTNPNIRLSLNLKDTTTLMDLVDEVRKLVKVIEEMENTPAVVYAAQPLLIANDPASAQQQARVQALLEEVSVQSVSFDLDANDIFAILQSIKLGPIENRMASVSFAVDGQQFDLQLGADAKNRNLAQLALAVDGVTYVDLQVVSLTRPSGGSTGDTPGDKPNDEDYVDVSQLGQFIRPITNLLEARAYEFEVQATLSDKAKESLGGAWNQTLRVAIDRVSNQEVAAKVSAELFRKTLTVTYVGDTVYLEYGPSVRMKLGVSEDSRLIQKIKELIAKENNGEVPEMDYTVFVPQSYLDFVDQVLPKDGNIDEETLVNEILGRVKRLSVKNRTASIHFAISEQDVLRANVTVNADGSQFRQVSLEGLNLFQSAVDVAVDITGIYENPLGLSAPTDADSYTDMDQAANFIDPILALINAKSYQFTVKLDTSLLDSIKNDWDGTLDVQLSRGDGNAIGAKVSATLFNKQLTLTYADDWVYLQYGDGVKVKLRTDDEGALVTKLKEIFADENGGQAPEMDYTAFVPQSYLDFVQDVLPKDGTVEMEQLIDRILGGLEYLSVQEREVEIHFSLGGSDTIKLTATLDDSGKRFTQATVKGLRVWKDGDGNYSDLGVTLDISKISEDANPVAAPEGAENFLDLDQLAGFIDPILSLVDARSYDLKVKLKSDPGTSGKLDIDQTIDVKVVRLDGDTEKDPKVDAQVSLQFLGEQLTLTYLYTDGKPHIYVQYGDSIKLYFAQSNMESLADDLTKFLADLLGKEQEEQGEQPNPEQDTKTIREIVKQLLPNDYADFFAEEFSPATIGSVIGKIRDLKVDETGNIFSVKLAVSEDEVITATVTKTTTDGSDRLSGLSVSGVTVLGSKTNVEVTETKISSEMEPLRTEIENSVKDGFVDVFGGTGEGNSQGVVIDQLTNALNKNPLKITFGVEETEPGKDKITHDATAFVDKNTAYAQYKSDKGVNPVKLKVNYDTINELLPSVLYLLDLDLDNYPQLKALAASLGIDPKKAIKSDVLSSLFDGLFDNAGLELTPDENLDFADTIKKITWKDNTIQIYLDSKKLYGESATQGDLMVDVKKEGGKTTVSVKNIHGSDTKTLNLTIELENVTQEQIKAQDTGYMDFNSLDQFYADLVNTASFREYQLKGNLNVNINLVGIVAIDLKVPVELKITLDDKGKLYQIYGKISPDYSQKIKLFGLGTAGVYDDTTRYTDARDWWDKPGIWPWNWTHHYERKKHTLQHIEFFYNPTGSTEEQKDVYFRRVYRTVMERSTATTGWWEDTNSLLKTSYTYATMNFDSMNNAADPTLFVMDYVYYCLPFNTNVAFLSVNLRDEINKNIKNTTANGVQPAVFENILKTFGFGGNTYSMSINPINLVQDGRFSDTMNLRFDRSPVTKGKDGKELVKNDGGSPNVLTQFHLDTKVVPFNGGYMVSMGADFNLGNYKDQTLTGLTGNDGKLPETVEDLSKLGIQESVK